MKKELFKKFYKEVDKEYKNEPLFDCARLLEDKYSSLYENELSIISDLTKLAIVKYCTLLQKALFTNLSAMESEEIIAYKYHLVKFDLISDWAIKKDLEQQENINKRKYVAYKS